MVSVDDLRHCKTGRSVQMDFLKWAVQRVGGNTFSTPPALKKTKKQHQNNNQPTLLDFGNCIPHSDTKPSASGSPGCLPFTEAKAKTRAARGAEGTAPRGRAALPPLPGTARRGGAAGTRRPPRLRRAGRRGGGTGNPGSAGGSAGRAPPVPWGARRGGHSGLRGLDTAVRGAAARRRPIPGGGAGGGGGSARRDHFRVRAGCRRRAAGSDALTGVGGAAAAGGRRGGAGLPPPPRRAPAAAAGRGQRQPPCPGGLALVVLPTPLPGHPPAADRPRAAGGSAELARTPSVPPPPRTVGCRAPARAPPQPLPADGV